MVEKNEDKMNITKYEQEKCDDKRCALTALHA